MTGLEMKTKCLTIVLEYILKLQNHITFIAPLDWLLGTGIGKVGSPLISLHGIICKRLRRANFCKFSNYALIKISKELLKTVKKISKLSLFIGM